MISFCVCVLLTLVGMLGSLHLAISGKFNSKVEHVFNVIFAVAIFLTLMWFILMVVINL